MTLIFKIHLFSSHVRTWVCRFEDDPHIMAWILQRNVHITTTYITLFMLFEDPITLKVQSKLTVEYWVPEFQRPFNNIMYIMMSANGVNVVRRLQYAAASLGTRLTSRAAVLAAPEYLPLIDTRVYGTRNANQFYFV